MPTGAAFILTLGCDGEQVYAIDLLERTVRTAATWPTDQHLESWTALLTAAATTAPPATRPELTHCRYEGLADIVGEPCYAVHFCDPQLKEHVYAAYSMIDGLPRRIERVRAGHTGHIETAQLILSNVAINPLIPDDAFDLSIPRGFRVIQEN